MGNPAAEGTGCFFLQSVRHLKKIKIGGKKAVKLAKNVISIDYKNFGRILTNKKGSTNI